MISPSSLPPSEIDVASRDIAINDMISKYGILVNLIDEILDSNEKSITVRERVKREINENQTSKVTAEIVKTLRSGSLVEIGNGINEKQRSIKEEILSQDSRTYPFLNMKRAIANVKSIEDDKQGFTPFESISLVKAIRKPFYFKKWETGDEIVKNHGIVGYSKKPGGDAEKAFEYFIAGSNFDRIAGDGPAIDVIDITMDHDCIATSPYGYITLSCFPRSKSTSWKINSLAFDDKSSAITRLKKLGFTRSGFDYNRNAEILNKNSWNSQTLGEKCKKETDEECFARWKHVDTGIQMISEKWSGTNLNNIKILVPGGKLAEWKKLSDKLLKIKNDTWTTVRLDDDREDVDWQW